MAALYKQHSPAIGQAMRYLTGFSLLGTYPNTFPPGYFWIVQYLSAVSRVPHLFGWRDTLAPNG
ncbi:hypothetical protein [Mucilaginibacter sp.]|uniref:hypothetical protein n=1 Tax=Mucilaginibacter sp. TaxID=1882438 RepID=UPI0026197E52|nr:hypothetical protein [Mucilaginibacter sp.]